MSRTTSHFNLASALRSMPRVRRAHRRVLSHDEQAVDFAVRHVNPVSKMGMIAGDARQPVESEIVFFGCVLAVVRLQQAHNVLVEVVPPSGFGRVVLDIILSSDSESASKNGIGRYPGRMS